MAEKDNSKQAQVTVQGQFANATSSAGVLHRSFHYQVNILHAHQQQAYDRVLHICEQGQPKPVVHITVETSPPQTTEAVCSETIDTSENVSPDKLIGSAQPSIRDTAPLGGDITRDHAGNNLPVGTDTTPETPIRRRYFLQTVPGRRALFNPLSPIPALQHAKSWLNETWHAVARFLPALHRRIIFPDLKPASTRRIFNPGPRNIAGKVGLIAACLALVFAVVYFMPHKNALIARLEPKPASQLSPVKAQAPPAYHAVIEKHPDGVVITIQGPAYEEVLTRLPPGYLPVVQDDKIVHIVTPGNTLWFIAKRYIKNPYRYPELVRLNKIKNPDRIYPGDRVIIQYVRKPAS